MSGARRSYSQKNNARMISKIQCSNKQCSAYGDCDLGFDCPFYRTEPYKPRAVKAVKEKPKENRNKLHAEKAVVDGITFDSRKEAKRYSELKLLERTGEIQNLELQKEYLLIPPQKDKDGKVIERALKYIADFVYIKDGKTIVEDVKGYRNPSTATYGKYVIKRKLMLYKYGIKIQEV